MSYENKPTKIRGRLNALYLMKFPYRMNWFITDKCNFDCEYCNTETKKQSPNTILTPKEIFKLFEKTKKNWLILMTGGEPFLYPNFVEVCQKLTKNHHLTITTNLTHKSICEFADKINPIKILCISASYHRDELIKNNLQKNFIENCLYLKEKGFCILVNFVAYPSNIPQINEDIQMFEKLDLECIVYGYRGKFNNKLYPNNYTKEELSFISKNSLDETEIMIVENDFKFKGHFCEAGSKYFVVKSNGDIQSCFTIADKIGNLFNGDLTLNSKSKICPSEICDDYYYGRAAVLKKAKLLQRIFHKVL